MKIPTSDACGSLKVESKLFPWLKVTRSTTGDAILAIETTNIAEVGAYDAIFTYCRVTATTSTAQICAPVHFLVTILDGSETCFE